MKSFPLRIYLFALILRLIPVLLTRALGIGLDDMFQYDMLARSMSSGNGYRWYAQEDLKLLEPYVNFDLSTAKGYDPQYGLYTSFRAPLYPAFLAVIYFFNGLDFSRFFAARLAQVILLGAPLAPLTYYVATSYLKNASLSGSEGALPSKARDSSVATPALPLSFASGTIVAGGARENAPSERHGILGMSFNQFSISERSENIAKISAYIVACYPMLLAYPLGLGTENLFFLLLLSSFLFLLKSIENSSAFHLLLSGLFLGLTALTRSVILPFAGLAILFLIVIARSGATKQSPSWNQGLLRRGNHPPRNDGIIIGIAFVLVITPWVIRNSLLHDKLTGIETSMGYNLYLGYHPNGNGSFMFGPSLDLLTIMDDAERDEVGTQKAIGFMIEQPERFVPLAINRLGFFFGLETRVLMYFYSNNLIGYISKPLLLIISAILLLPFVFVSVSACLGLSLLKWNSQTALLLLLLTFYLLPHVFILAEDRFHLALIPFFAILAMQFWAVGFQAISARWHESNAGKWVVTLAVLGVFLLFLNWGFELSRDADKIAALLGQDGNKTYYPY